VEETQGLISSSIRKGSKIDNYFSEETQGLISSFNSKFDYL